MAMTFTAVQIAEALGRTPRGVRKALKGIMPRGVTIVQGKVTATWELDQLPTRLKVALEEMVKKRSLPQLPT